MLLIQGARKAALDLLGNPLPARSEFRNLGARRRMLQGREREIAGDFPNSLRILNDAASMAASANAASLSTEIEVRKGPILSRLGDSAGAERCLHNALDMAIRQGDVYFEAAAVGNLAVDLMERARYDEAVPWLERTLLLSEKSGALASKGLSLGNLGRCYRRLGDHDRAIQFLSQAAEIAKTTGDIRRQQSWTGTLADEAIYVENDAARGVTLYKEALALARRVGDNFDTLQWLYHLAQISLESGDVATAEKLNREALELSRKTESKAATIWATFIQAEISRTKGSFAEAESGYHEALSLSERWSEQSAVWRTHNALGNLYAAEKRPREAEAEFTAALDGVEAARAGMKRDDWKFGFRANSRRLYDDYINFLMNQGRAERALEVVESSRARVLAEKLGLLQSSKYSSAAGRFRQIARARSARLVSIWLGPKRSFVWVVAPNRIEAVVLPGEAQITSAVDAYKAAIQGLRDPLETANPAGRTLSQLLLAPLARLIPRGAQVVLVPDGPLHELNLESLPAPTDPPRYWLEDVALEIAPSLALLGQTVPTAAWGRKSLLLIGAPVVPGNEFAPLPDAEKEVADIQGRFQAPLVLTGAAANPGAYREAEPGRFELIHFSAHATGNRASPLDSAVILSQKGDRYKLYAREVIGLPLRARLVTISACRSAGARVYSGEGLVGFAWAFLEAGAQNVIAGLWDVNDRSTALMMGRLYAGLSQGRSPSAALRAAKLEMANSRGPYRKPYYWAPFEIFTRSSR